MTRYPKHPKKISVQLSRREIQDGIMSGDCMNKIVPLSDKLDDYLVGLGYTSAHVTGIITQLFTQGKVRVDFRNYTERMELSDSHDKLTSLQSVSLLNDYITELSKGRAILGPKNTQNITVEPLAPVRDLLKEAKEKETQKAGNTDTPAESEK
jgi:hypothetical protein